MKRVFCILIVLMMFSELYSQNDDSKTMDGSEAFFFDAIVFQGNSPDSASIDCYALVPYQTLNFTKSGETYVSKFQIIVSVFDSLGNKVTGRNIEKSLAETDFAVAQGGTAKFSNVKLKITVTKGTYKVKCTLSDEFAHTEYSMARTVSVVNFNDFKLSMSALMLISSIEDKNGKMVITPHLSDNVANLRDGFFTFFEVYNQEAEREIDFLYQIFDGDELIMSGERVKKTIQTGKNQVYIRVTKPKAMNKSTYILRILALKPSELQDYEIADVLSIAQRSIKSVNRMSSFVMSDISKAIKQLRYVAYQKDLDPIEDARTDEDKFELFEAFWKQLDPTPGTERNEAFDEFYGRVQYANKTFRSYSEGWMTDKGMVYCIFGPPATAERSNGYGDGRIYERWTYASNREFLFVDNSGFGDFRLVRPVHVSEKYEYGR